MTNADRKNVSFAQAKPLDTNAIPILDLGPDIRSGDLRHLAKGILHAATNTGFFYIRNHGIPEDAIIRAWAVAKGFFALDGDEKATIAVNKHQRGWMATGMSQMQGAKAHDLKEVFFWGREVAADDPDLQREGEDRGEASKSLIADFGALFTRIIEDRRTNPTDDLASMLANAKMADGSAYAQSEAASRAEEGGAAEGPGAGLTRRWRGRLARRTRSSAPR